MILKLIPLPGKLLKLAVALVVLVVVAGLVVYFNLNRIVRRTIETQATQSLALTTTLDSARLSLLGGKLRLGDLRIASPQGFASPHMMTLDSGSVSVRYGELKKDPVHISELTLNKPVVVVEQANGQFNFKTLMDLPPSESELRLIIDKLTINNATVILRPGLPGLDATMKEVNITIPSLTLEKIGTGDGNQNGAAIKQVAVEVIAALAQKAGEVGNLADNLRASLENNARSVLNQVQGQLGAKLQELDKTAKQFGLEGLGKNLGGELNNAVGDPQKQAIDKPASDQPRRRRDRQQ